MTRPNCLLQLSTDSSMAVWYRRHTMRFMLILKMFQTLKTFGSLRRSSVGAILGLKCSTFKCVERVQLNFRTTLVLRSCLRFLQLLGYVSIMFKSLSSNYCQKRNHAKSIICPRCWRTILQGPSPATSHNNIPYHVWISLQPHHLQPYITCMAWEHHPNIAR